MCFDSDTFICDMCDIDWKIVNQKLDKKADDYLCRWKVCLKCDIFDIGFHWDLHWGRVVFKAQEIEMLLTVQSESWQAQHCLSKVMAKMMSLLPLVIPNHGQNP